jgi:hypothetical protein
MKATELIAVLQSQVAKHGDLEVLKQDKTDPLGYSLAIDAWLIRVNAGDKGKLEGFFID